LLSGDATPLEDAPDVDADTAESASTMEPDFLPPDVDADAPDLDGQDCAAVDAEVEAELDAEVDDDAETDAPPVPTPSETVQAADPPGA
jgi:hypothetical protein